MSRITLFSILLLGCASTGSIGQAGQAPQCTAPAPAQVQKVWPDWPAPSWTLARDLRNPLPIFKGWYCGMPVYSDKPLPPSPTYNCIIQRKVTWST